MNIHPYKNIVRNSLVPRREAILDIDQNIDQTLKAIEQGSLPDLITAWNFRPLTLVETKLHALQLVEQNPEIICFLVEKHPDLIKEETVKQLALSAEPGTSPLLPFLRRGYFDFSELAELLKKALKKNNQELITAITQYPLAEHAASETLTRAIETHDSEIVSLFLKQKPLCELISEKKNWQSIFNYAVDFFKGEYSATVEAHTTRQETLMNLLETGEVKPTYDHLQFAINNRYTQMEACLRKIPRLQLFDAVHRKREADVSSLLEGGTVDFDTQIEVLKFALRSNDNSPAIAVKLWNHVDGKLEIKVKESCFDMACKFYSSAVNSIVISNLKDPAVVSTEFQFGLLIQWAGSINGAAKWLNHCGRQVASKVFINACCNIQSRYCTDFRKYDWQQWLFNDTVMLREKLEQIGNEIGSDESINKFAIACSEYLQEKYGIDVDVNAMPSAEPLLNYALGYADHLQEKFKIDMASAFLKNTATRALDTGWIKPRMLSELPAFDLMTDVALDHVSSLLMPRLIQAVMQPDSLKFGERIHAELVKNKLEHDLARFEKTDCAPFAISLLYESASIIDLLHWSCQWHQPQMTTLLNQNKTFDGIRWTSLFVNAKGVQTHTINLPQTSLVVDAEGHTINLPQQPGWSLQCLSNAKALKQEGETLNHCVGTGTYIRKGINGESHFVSIVNPDGDSVSTIEYGLRSGTHGALSVNNKQHRARGNDVPTATELDIEEWCRIGIEKRHLTVDLPYLDKATLERKEHNRSLGLEGLALLNYGFHPTSGYARVRSDYESHTPFYVASQSGALMIHLRNDFVKLTLKKDEESGVTWQSGEKKKRQRTLEKLFDNEVKLFAQIPSSMPDTVDSDYIAIRSFLHEKTGGKIRQVVPDLSALLTVIEMPFNLNHPGQITITLPSTTDDRALQKLEKKNAEKWIRAGNSASLSSSIPNAILPDYIALQERLASRFEGVTVKPGPLASKKQAHILLLADHTKIVEIQDFLASCVADLPEEKLPRFNIGDTKDVLEITNISPKILSSLIKKKNIKAGQ